MSSDSSSRDENQYSHRQGSVTSLPDDDDQRTLASEPSVAPARQVISSPEQHVSLSPTVNVEHRTASRLSNDEDKTSQADSHEDVTRSFGFQQIETPTTDANYEALVRSKQLFYDPDPEIIRKPQMIKPLIYRQNISIKFLKPPPFRQEPLIIREVRPPQPPPPPPLIIRQRAPPPLSPPPIILRERPPRIPEIITAQVVTRTLPPIPPPPRSVVIEKLPPLPPKPQDIIIERWVPYQWNQKRQVIVQPAEPATPYPPPKNIIISYDPVDARVVRQFERLGVALEDPERYAARYADSLLETEQLLAQAKELGITEDISPPRSIDSQPHGPEQESFNIDRGNWSYENATGKSPSYAPTYENLLRASADLGQSSEQENTFFSNHGEDLSAQLAQYGMTMDSIPF